MRIKQINYFGMISLDKNIILPSRFKFVQLFFEQKFLNKDNTRLPLNDFVLNKDKTGYVASNTDNILVSFDEFVQASQKGLIDDQSE